ncbi:MAG: hypothetical protein RMN25_01330 [Anaerolineae bacterium]|nr:hypothetical protein [Thermoflexales bacterium]MDW8406397.1 hypothetical protein [Anaerolineae bacterium]
MSRVDIHRPAMGRIAVKALALFVLINALFVLVDPLPAIGSLSAYNVIFPGRPRLPYSDFPDRAYNLSLYTLNAMFAAHEINAGPKPADEYRILLIGDSSVWGFLLKPEQTLAAYLNAGRYMSPDGRRVRVYNLGYPIMSVTKDLLLLREAMRYQPDLIVWLVTLESLPRNRQLIHPLVQNNASAVRALIAEYGLALDPNDARLIDPSVFDRTVVGRRRHVADIIRLQLYGVLWAATGIDQDYPDYEPAAIDLEADETFHDLKPPMLRAEDLALDVLRAGHALAGATPILLVNEPILISNGRNSDVRYNFFYPRWAYDQYRALLAAEAQRNRWHYLDVWDIVPMSEFTNSAVHLTPAGSLLLANRIAEAVQKIARRD